MISNIIQIILALFIIIILYIIAYYTFNYESMNIVKVMGGSKARKIELFKGIYDYSLEKEVSYNTYSNNTTQGAFRELIPSINQYGGAEYSYSFWLKVDPEKLQNATDNNENIILFFRGSKHKIRYNTPNQKNCLMEANNKYILVKNPLIRMKKDGTSIIVEYNSVSNPDTFREDGIEKIDCSGDWDSKNKGLLGIYNMTDNEYKNKWFMFTVVLQEITPEDDILHRFKTRCKIYLNGVNMLNRIVEAPFNGQDNTSYGSAAMKHNRGKLYVNPGDILTGDNNPLFSAENTVAGEGGLQMADLSYFNYALEQDEIIKLFKKGFNKERYTIPEEELNVIDYTITKIDLENIKKFPDGY
tara:strand:+ start:6827 stop:7897 length:1071 start_codon:yes stop_codon:yes gene_type:complete